MTDIGTDVIDELAGLARGTYLDTIRDHRPAARENAQKSYEALFAPADPAGVTLAERFAVALFVAGLHRDERITAFYRDGLVRYGAELVAAVEDEVRRGETSGPYGRYPVGPLSVEDDPGIVHRVVDANRYLLGTRLAAAFEHAHLLVFRPRDASPAALQALLDAGWTTADIVTLSQLVAFLSFQVRVVVGLRALAASADAPLAAIPVSPVAAA